MRVPLFLLALLTASAGFAQSTTLGLYRVPSPDGGISVLTACNEAEIKRIGTKEKLLIECVKGGIRYVAVSGEKTSDGKVPSYGQELAAARVNAGVDQVKEIRVDGYQGFRVLCESGGELICLQVINYRPRLPLIMGAFKIDPKSTLPYDSTVLTNTTLFYGSLRIER
jgi:hypothetical protein